MDQFFRITDDVVCMPNKSIELSGSVAGYHPQAPSVALDFEGDAGFQYLVEQFVDVLPQFRSGDNHYGTFLRTYVASISDEHNGQAALNAFLSLNRVGPAFR
jgi:hypothetical protein